MKSTDTLQSWNHLHILEEAILYRPERVASLQDFITKESCSYIPVGNHHACGDTALHQKGIHLQMKRLNRILSFDRKTGIIKAEAGITLQSLTDFAISKRYIPSVVPDTGFHTLGGTIAGDLHGFNHETAGSFANSILSFELLIPDGTIHNITPEQPLFWATVGGIGLTGIILTVTLQLQRSESATLKVRRQQKKNLASLLDGLNSLSDIYSVAWIDGLATGNSLGKGILETAHPVSIEVPYDRSTPSKIPFPIPSFVMNRHFVKIFNHFYYNRAEVSDREIFEDFRNFSFSTDSILHWNHLYGKKGFYVFEAIIPFTDGEYTLRNILKKIHSSSVFSASAKLRKCKKGNQGLLSFPKEGYNLELHFPNQKGTLILLKTLEAILLDVGGCIHIAKDNILSSSSFAEFYPKKQAFLDILQTVDPNNKLMSNAAKRLGLKDE